MSDQVSSFGSEPIEWNLTRSGAKAVHVTSPAPRAIWQEILDKDPESLVPQTPEWTDVICSTQKYVDASRLYEFPGGRMQVLPMARRALLPAMISKQASMPPAWGMGGLVGNAPATPEEIAAILEDVSRLPVLSTSIRPNPLFAEAWKLAPKEKVLAEPRCAHVLTFDCCFDDIWSKKFSHQARGSVRKAERCGLTVDCDSTGKYIPIYYQLMMISVNRWAEQQHEPRMLSYIRAWLRDPMVKFQRIAEKLGRTMDTWVAWQNGQPIAALLVLQGKNVYCFKSAMNKELAGPTHANELLHRMAIEKGCAAGCRRYHLGESGKSTSLAQFKQRFGAEPVDYAEYFIEHVPLTPLDRKVRSAAKWVIGFQDAH